MRLGEEGSGTGGALSGAVPLFSGAEVEYQHVGQRVYAAQPDFGGFIGDGDPVSGNQRVSVEADGAGCDVYPGFARGGC